MYIRIENLLKEKENNKRLLRLIFSKLSESLEETIFNYDCVYLSFNNQITFNTIYKKLTEFGFKNSIIEENILTNLNKIGSIIFPLSEKNNIYELANVFVLEEKQEVTFILKVDTISLLNKEQVSTTYIEKVSNIKLETSNSLICVSCNREIPKEINFCIFCGYENNKRKESINTYSIKISKIEDKSIVFKIAKYLDERTHEIGYQKILEHLLHLPTIFYFSAYHSQAEKFFNLLDEYQVIFKLTNTDVFSIDKLISRFVAYGNINLGIMKSSKDFFDPIISKMAIELLQTASAENLKKAVTKSLFETYRMLNLLRNQESSLKKFSEEIEKDLAELLLKLLLILKRADQLNLCFIDNSPSKINKEIAILKDRIEKSSEPEAIKNYEDALNLKEKELLDLNQITQAMEILESQMLSVITILGTMRTKVIHLNTFDIQKNKGDYSELKTLKNNLLEKLVAMEDVVFQ